MRELWRRRYNPRAERLPNSIYLGAREYTLDDFTYALRLEAENAARHIVTANGNAALDGSGACDFDGTGDYLTFDTSNDWDLGTGDFSIEGFFKADTIGGQEALLGTRTGDGVTTINWCVYIINTPDNAVGFQAYDTGGSSLVAFDSVATWNTGTWYHFYVGRSGANFYVAIDGQVTSSVGNTNAIDSDTANMQVGKFVGSALGDFDGKMDRVVIKKGICEHTSNFTPPTRTDAITTDANTVLALNFDGAAASTAIMDSATPADATATGGVSDTSGNYKHATQGTGANQPTYNAGGGNPYLTFDGTNDYLAQATFVQAQTFTAYMVANVTADTVAQTLFGDTNAYIQFGSDEIPLANAGSSITDTIARDGFKRLFAVEFSNTTSALYVDGLKYAEGTAGAGALAAFGIGANSAGSNPTAMDFYRCYVQSSAYDSTLNGVIADAESITVYSSFPASDSFSGTGTDSGSVTDQNYGDRWTAGSWVGTGSEAIVAGQLQITATASNNARYSSLNHASISGDFDIQTDWAEVTNPSSGNSFFMLNLKLGGVEWHIRRDPTGINANDITANKAGVDGNSFNTAVTSGKFRIARSGTTVTLYYDIGAGWVALDSGTDSGAMTTNYTLGIKNISGAVGNLVVAFDNVTLTDGTDPININF